MPRRNLATEFKEMGIESDDAEYEELEAADRRHQDERCLEDYHKDVRDFIAWRNANRPSKKSTDSSC